MNVREAIEQLSKLPGELELIDQYGENVITGFEVDQYSAEDGDHDFVAYRQMETE